MITNFFQKEARKGQFLEERKLMKLKGKINVDNNLGSFYWPKELVLPISVPKRWRKIRPKERC